MYLDSGSGSMLASAIIAGAAGVGVVAKMQWRKVTGGLRKGKAVDNTTTTTDSEQG